MGMNPRAVDPERLKQEEMRREMLELERLPLKARLQAVERRDPNNKTRINLSRPENFLDPEAH